jgi:T5orf172 domain
VTNISKNSASGYVYVYRVHGQPGYKIGESYDSGKRGKGHSFVVEAPEKLREYPFPDRKAAERRIHELLDVKRVRQGREFFKATLREIDVCARQVKDEGLLAARQLRDTIRFLEDTDFFEDGQVSAKRAPTAVGMLLEARVKGFGSLTVGEAVRTVLKGLGAGHRRLGKSMENLGLLHSPSDGLVLFDRSEDTQLRAFFQDTQCEKSWKGTLARYVGVNSELELVEVADWCGQTKASKALIERVMGCE